MLTQEDVVPYLLRRRLLSPGAVVAGDLLVIDASRRHRNFHVAPEGGPGLFLKQATSEDRRATLSVEAAVYDSLQRQGAEAAPSLTPACEGYFSEDHVLVLEAPANSEDLRSYFVRRGRVSLAQARDLGRSLAILHGRGLAAGRHQALAHRLTSRPAWALAIHHPDLRFLNQESAGSIAVIEIIQSSARLCSLVDALRREWRADSLIHGDVKWDNCIIFPPGGTGRRTALRLVDWECAALGDARWDVGAVFSDFLTSWVITLPFVDAGIPEEHLALSRFSIDRMHPAIAAFWRGYVRARGFDAPAARECLRGAVRFAAVRLLQTAFEQTQESAELPRSIASLVQLSLNILERTEDASLYLLGLPCGDPRVT